MLPLLALRRGCSWRPRGGVRCPRPAGGPLPPPPSPPPLPRRGFATTVFNVRARPEEGGAGEQTLFLVGLNEGKFFGQDGAEEGLKLLERIAEHGPQYNLLFGLTERELAELEEDHKVKNQRLTPSRELEGKRNCEVVPIVQAGMVDRRPRRALGRVLRTTQSHVSWQLWKHPREAVKLYWAYWRRKQHKDAALRSFWTQHFPVCSHAYYAEGSELIAIRATELLAAAHNQGRQGTWVLVVSNQLFEPVAERLKLLLDETAAEKFASADFVRHLRERASELCVDVPDLTPLILFVYLGLPLLLVQTTFFALQRAWVRSGIKEQILPPEHRD